MKIIFLVFTATVKSLPQFIDLLLKQHPQPHKCCSKTLFRRLQNSCLRMIQMLLFFFKYDEKRSALLLSWSSLRFLRCTYPCNVENFVFIKHSVLFVMLQAVNPTELSWLNDCFLYCASKHLIPFLALQVTHKPEIQQTLWILSSMWDY